MATQNPQHQVVFVSWDDKQQSLWDQLGELIEILPGIHGQYKLAFWNSTANANPQERSSLRERLFAPIHTRMHRLRRHLRGGPFRVDDEHSDPEITLVAHGKACRVVKQYLLNLLEDSAEDWRDLRRVRQVIFLSPSRRNLARLLVAAAVVLTVVAILSEILKLKYGESAPALNSLATLTVIVSGLLAFLLTFLLSAEARKQVGVDEKFDTDDLDKQFDELITNGSKRRAGTWPIPSQVLSIPRLTRSADTAETIGETILKPKGHKNVYELDRVTVRTEAEPLTPPQMRSGVVGRGPFDNRALRTQIVKFSAEDATAETDLPPYQIRYRTNGYMEVDKEPTDNLWSPLEAGEWSAQHQMFIYAFRPQRDVEYKLEATVYGGFNAGDQSAHTHIDVTHYIKKLEYNLDLRGYLAAGWTISRPPELYYFPPSPPRVVHKDRIFDDERCDCLATGRKLERGRPLTVVMKEPGRFQWVIYSIRNGGIIGFLFEVSPQHQDFR